MIRVSLGSVALLALIACQAPIPDSGAQFEAEQARRNAALARSTTQTSLPAAPGVSEQALPSNPAAAPLPSSVTSAVQGADPLEAQAAAQASAANSGVAPVQANPSNPAPAVVNSAGISSEQDFGAVSSRRSIQSDADRIAANRAQYTVIAPTALPTRSGGSQPNIVAYALSTTHPVGTQLHRRTRLRSASRQAAACRAFPSPDQAQIEFLSLGGPDRDRKGLDPDGDGFACSWDPSPFRAARQAAAPAVAPATAATGVAQPTPAQTALSQNTTEITLPAPGIAPPLAISNE